MPSHGSGALLPIIAGLLLLIILGGVAVYTVPWLIAQVLFHGDPSAGLGVGFMVLEAVIVLILVDIAAAILLGRWLYKFLNR